MWSLTQGHTLFCQITPFFYSARNARIASAVLAMAIPSVRPSVCLSVTRRYCVKTTARSTVVVDGRSYTPPRLLHNRRHYPYRQYPDIKGTSRNVTYGSKQWLSRNQCKVISSTVATAREHTASCKRVASCRSLCFTSQFPRT